MESRPKVGVAAAFVVVAAVAATAAVVAGRRRRRLETQHGITFAHLIFSLT